MFLRCAQAGEHARREADQRGDEDQHGARHGDAVPEVPRLDRRRVLKHDYPHDRNEHEDDDELGLLHLFTPFQLRSKCRRDGIT